MIKLTSNSYGEMLHLILQFEYWACRMCSWLELTMARGLLSLRVEIKYQSNQAGKLETPNEIAF